MTEGLRRLHMWVGLFNLTALVVFAVAGITVTFPPAQSRPAVVRTIPYEAPGGFNDVQVAGQVYERVGPPLLGPLPDWAVHRNAEGVLALDFWTPNGVYRATVLEADKQIRLEHARNSLGEFLNMMHGVTGVDPPLRTPLQWWAIYANASIFSLLFMSLTGTWLWLASRPRLWWAWASIGAGAALFAGLWFVTR